MFLHERTQIAWCRVGFVLLCVVPTLLVAAWALWLRQPAYVRLVERRLSGQCGLVASIREVSHPAQGMVRATEVTLLDPTTREVLASSPVVELVQTAAGVQIRARQAVVDSRIAAALGDFVRRRLHRFSGGEGGLWFVVNELRWRAGQDEFCFADCKSGIECAHDADQAFLAFKTPDNPARDGPRMRIVRGHAIGLAPYEVQIHTGQTALPCRLFEPMGIQSAWLGSEAQFQGSAWCHLIDGEWVTQIVGRFSRVRLEAALEGNAAHRLTGPAEVAITPGTAMRFRAGRLERLSATITAGPGEVSPSLLAAAFRHLGMPSVASPVGSAQQAAQPYSRLAFDVEIDRQGLAIVGRCDQQGTVLCDDRGALLAQPRQRQPVARLIEALAPPTKLVIPATPQAQRLARFLPLPEAALESPVQRVGVRPSSGSN
jgi:hypothetical protein